MVPRPRRSCDTRHDLWERAGGYRVAELRADLAAVPEVASTVCVESSSGYHDSRPEQPRPVGATEWITRNAIGVAQGIVGDAELRLGGAVEEVLAAPLEAGAGLFRDEFRVLARLGLSFDTQVYCPQLPEVAEPARAFPDVQIVLDHRENPARYDELDPGELSMRMNSVRGSGGRLPS